jgi:hypothetical protein
MQKIFLQPLLCGKSFFSVSDGNDNCDHGKMNIERNVNPRAEDKEIKCYSSKLNFITSEAKSLNYL